MSATKKHLRTPGPWRTGTGLADVLVYADGFAVANAIVYHGRHEKDAPQANARFIVRACNSYDELLDALTGLLEEWPASRHMEECVCFKCAAVRKARAVVAKATADADPLAP